MLGVDYDSLFKVETDLETYIVMAKDKRDARRKVKERDKHCSYLDVTEIEDVYALGIAGID